VPNEDMGEFTVHLDMPEGTSLEGTSEIAKSLAKEMAGIDGVAELEPSITSRVTHIHLTGYLVPFEERKVSLDKVVADVRRRMLAHPSYKPTVTVKNPIGGGEQGGYPVTVNILGPDMGQLADYAMKALALAQKMPSLTDPKVSVNISNPEIHVAVDRKRAADLGVRMATIGNTLRLAVAGSDQISNYREGAEQYPVKIRVLESQRRDIDAIGRLTVPSASGVPVRIDNIAHLERGLGPTTLSRFNRQFSVGLSSDIAAGHELDEASNEVRRMLAGLNMPPEMSFKLSGASKILDETTANLIMAISLAMIFVYMVLAAQFESFIQPIVIMLAVPVAIPFALFTLWVTGRPLSLWSALGVLLLFGIVKKNSILQVDYANVLRAKGMSIREAITQSCRTRLRPILMTTSAIIAGLLPTSLGLGIGGQGRAAIAITVIGGQSLCLFLTLLLVPVAYVKFDALEQSLLNRRWKDWVGQAKGGLIGRLRPAPEKL
jgi:HAE1 family hydrophobic/amphiphilic exporter-1